VIPLSERIVGLIVSLPNQIIYRMLHGRNVYASPTSRDSPRLKAGDRVFLHGADGPGVLVAEGKILKTRFEKLDELVRHGGKLFLSKDELEKYLADRGHEGSDPLLVLELGQVTEYAKPVKCPFSVPPSGNYVTENTIQKIIQANR